MHIVQLLLPLYDNEGHPFPKKLLPVFAAPCANGSAA